MSSKRENDLYNSLFINIGIHSLSLLFPPVKFNDKMKAETTRNGQSKNVICVKKLFPLWIMFWLDPCQLAKSWSH